MALVGTVGAFASIGLAIATIPFVSSLQPTPTAGRMLLKLDIREMKPGQFAYFNSDFRVPFPEKILVIDDYDGALSVFRIWLHDDQFRMPDVHWWGSSGSCEHFGPQLENGRLLRYGIITCNDPDLDEWRRVNWRWDYKGKNLAGSTDNLYSPPFIVQDGFVIIGRSR